MFDNIPQELRAYAQWVVWRYEQRDEGKPTKVPYDPKSGFLAKVDDLTTCGTFEQAVHVAGTNSAFAGIGFVLTESDPYCFIDLDGSSDQKITARQTKIFEAFDSYSERSPSGTGCHIIVKGHVPRGRKRSSVEIYSSLRYMTMTGDVVQPPKPINERGDLCIKLWTEMGTDDAKHAYDIDEPQREDDNVVIQRAINAANGAKFTDLFHGRWQQHYPEQAKAGQGPSEADFALIDMIAFYTQNREQIRRIFLASALGQRDKVLKRPKYVNEMIRRSFDRHVPPVDFKVFQEQAAALIAARQTVPRDAEPTQSPYSMPPGLMGEIAEFIYRAAPRQVAEVALTSAIGLMAALCGRAFNTQTGAGLNMFILLLAQTGIGKDGMYSGMDRLVEAVSRLTPDNSKAAPSIREFIGPSDIRSEAALVRELGSRLCFVARLEEFGLKLRAMTSDRAPMHLLALRATILALYTKSGWGQSYGEMVYADKAKNTPRLQSPALSILADATPQSFLEGASEELIEHGVLPRFLIIEYHGKANYNNPHAHLAQPSDQLKGRLIDLTTLCHRLNQANQVTVVLLDDEAQVQADRYMRACVDKLNEDQRGPIRELVSRAHLKALKLASLVAVGVNPYQPKVTAEHWQWAERIVSADVDNLCKHFEKGDVGPINSNEQRQYLYMIRCVEEYLTDGVAAAKKSSSSYFGPGLVPKMYFQRRTAAIAAFKRATGGATRALDTMLRLLVDNGILREVPADDHRRGGFGGKLYQIEPTALLELSR